MINHIQSKHLPFKASTFPHGGFALVAVDVLFPSSSQQVCSLLVEKFRVDLRKQAQVDGTSLLPPFMTLKIIEHVRFVQWGLTVHQLSSSPDPFCSV